MKYDLEAKPMKRVPVASQFVKAKVAALVALVTTLSYNAQAVWIEETDGAVSFTPADLINPVITAAVAALVAALGLFVLYRGAKWIMKVFSATK